MVQTFSRVSFEETSKGREALHMGQAGSFSYFTVCVYTPSMPVYLSRHIYLLQRSPKTGMHCCAGMGMGLLYCSSLDWSC